MNNGNLQKHFMDHTRTDKNSNEPKLVVTKRKYKCEPRNKIFNIRKLLVKHLQEVAQWTIHVPFIIFHSTNFPSYSITWKMIVVFFNKLDKTIQLSMEVQLNILRQLLKHLNRGVNIELYNQNASLIKNNAIGYLKKVTVNKTFGSCRTWD